VRIGWALTAGVCAYYFVDTSALIAVLLACVAAATLWRMSRRGQLASGFAPHRRLGHHVRPRPYRR
jgi:hypothetical protein